MRRSLTLAAAVAIAVALLMTWRALRSPYWIRVR